MANILITGGTGFIGRNLIPELLEIGHELVAIVRPSSEHETLPKEVIRQFVEHHSNIQDAFVDQKIDAVIHLATDYAHHSTDDSLVSMLDSNIIFGSLLLSAMRKNGCTRLINATSCAEFDTNGDYSPNSLYAASKRAFRDICQYYSETQDLKRIDLVLYDNYGTNDKRKKLVSLLCDALLSKTPIDLSPGEQRLNLIHINDTVNALTTALDLCLKQELTPFSPIYSVAPSNSINVKMLVSMLESIYDHRLNVTWGGRPYRDNELMKPWVGNPVPGWSQTVTLENGLKELLMASTKRT